VKPKKGFEEAPLEQERLPKGDYKRTVLKNRKREK